MTQIFYSLIALVMVGIFSLSVYRGVRDTEQRMYVNEAATQIAGLCMDMLEDIGRDGIAFDEQTDEARAPQPITYPLVTSASQLTPENQFGGCTDIDLCLDIDDFHGLTQTIDIDGLPYTINISVRYVDPLNPNVKTGTQTFAKEVELEVTSPFMVKADSLIQMRVPRVFTYDQITS